MEIDKNLKDVEFMVVGLNNIDAIIPDATKDILCTITENLKISLNHIDNIDKTLQDYIDRIYVIRKAINDKIDLVEEELTNRILKEINE